MVRLVILGSGNVAFHLAKAFQSQQQVSVEAIWVRRPEKHPDFQNYTYRVVESIKELPQADIYLIAVSDSAIATVANQLPVSEAMVVHTSGATALNILDKHRNRGVFYPVQSFSSKGVLKYTDIPVLLETNLASNRENLQILAEALSGKYRWADSEERLQYHLAATIVNNFSNHFYHLAERHLAAKGLDFNQLKPLIAETARKIEHLAPGDAQTGPAKRKDEITINKHLEALEDEHLKTLYKQITLSILNSDEKL